MRTFGLLALALVACSGDKSDDSSTTTPNPGTPTTGTATGTGTGTGTGSTTTAEDCENGVDDDGDGLLDCEDSDCADDPACGETDCADGLDNDGDSRIDCVDEDCWGNGCAVTQATLASTGLVRIDSRYSYTNSYGDPSCAGSTSAFYGRIGLNTPAGQVRFMPANTATWTTCSWTAGSSWITVSSSSGQLSPTPVQRSGFAIDPGCPVQDSAFLPQYWTVGYGAGYSLDFQTRPTGTGPVWWSLQPVYTGTPNYSSTSTVIPGSPCTVQQSSYTNSISMQGATVGSSYIQVGP